MNRNETKLEEGEKKTIEQIEVSSAEQLLDRQLRQLRQLGQLLVNEYIRMK